MTLEVGDKVTLEVGNKIDAWCGRCKSMLRHTIEVITGEKIGRVHCNSCKGRHLYRAAAPRTRGAAAALTQERKYGATWSIPGGRVEPGETMTAACVREVIEETAIPVRLDGASHTITRSLEAEGVDDAGR